MSIKDIKAFSTKAREDAALGEKLKACQKVREMLSLSSEYGIRLMKTNYTRPTNPNSPKNNCRRSW